jgi:hypothetical protein
VTNLPRVEKPVPVSAEQQALWAAEAAKMRADHAASQLAEEPARRAAIAAGPALRDLEAAVTCFCSCHPRPADPRLHEGGVSCPCQLTDAERAESLESLRGVLSESSEAQESYETEMRRRVDEAATRLGAEIRDIGGAAPFVIRGVVDGRGFYLRERHDLWSVVIAPDDDPLSDPWARDREVPVIEVASGESATLEKEGVFDPVHALEVAVNAVRIFLLRRSCAHDKAGRFCPACGVEVAQADAWRIEARRDS